MKIIKLFYLTLFALILLLSACGSATPVSTPDASPAETAYPGPLSYPGPQPPAAVIEYPAPAGEALYPAPLEVSTPSSQGEGTNGEASACQPTPADELGPFYVPGAPERDKIGEGYVLSGVVRGYPGCAALSDAQIEFWMAGPDGEYGDDYRATLFIDEQGAYRFESHVPVPYDDRPPHIHIRVMADGYETLITQHYPQSGATSAEMDLVLVQK